MLGSIPFDSSLRDALGDRLRVLPAELKDFAVTGVVPKSVALPKGLKEAALALAAASAEGAIVVIRGAGTKSHRPPPPRTIDLAIDATTCAGASIEHDAADLTVTAGAGTRLAELDEVLAKKGQFWPCDAPFAESATIGGTIAARANGALRQGYGSLRDLILGARMLAPDGTIIRTGARVVKSVAGYDMHKLLVGSFGTLGLIMEVSLKVWPLPESERTAAAVFGDQGDASDAAASIARSNLGPMAMTIHDDRAARHLPMTLPRVASGEWLLIVRCGGNVRSTAKKIDGTIAIFRAAGASATANLEGIDSKRAWMQIRELAGGTPYSPNRFVVLKIAALPSDTGAVLAAARAVWPDAELTAHPFAGLVFVHIASQPGPFAPPAYREFFDACASAGWTAEFSSSPADGARALPQPPLGATPVRLLRAVKAAFDPAGVLDPGRLPGGV